MSEPPTTTQDHPDAVVVAVPDDAVDELVQDGLVAEIPTLRGPVLDAVVTIGVDSAAIVTLLQAPDTLRAFAAWIRRRATARQDSIKVSARRSGRIVELQVSGDVPVEAVTAFLDEALTQQPPANGTQ